MAHDRFRDWIDAYERAWRSAGTDAALALFTEDAVYSPAPFDDPVVGHEAIAAFWEAERVGPDEGFTLDASFVAVEDDTAVARIEVAYADPPRTYLDLWVITLAADGRCAAFEEWPFFPGRERAAG